MASFEQNQQDQFNMNNSLDQVKQFQAELDKATTSIGAAELEAEEELLGVRLKNLSKTQQTKLVQLGQLLELEEKGIQELAKLKLTLSNRQFAVRKKEIQKEFQLYKAAAEELVKAESQRKASKQGKTSTKSSSTANDLKASNKKAPADVVVQKASKKVQSAEYAVGQVSQEITDAISAMQEIAQAATEAAQTKAKPQVEQKPGTPTGQGTNQQGAQPVAPKVTETRYGNGGLDSSDKVGLGEYSAQKVFSLFEGLRNDLEKDPKNESILTDLNQVIAAKKDKDGNVVKDKAGNVIYESSASQTTLDITGALLDSIAKANDKEAELQEFRKDAETLALNRRLLALKQEQDERARYQQEYEQLQADGFNHLVENMSAAEFAALRAETAAIEKEIEQRGKTAAASEKALATLRGKGTLKEKKELLKAQIEMQAAQKDWSKASEKFQMKKITDDMSDEDRAAAQKHNEGAKKNRLAVTAAEMAINAAVSAIADFAQKLSGKTDEIAKIQGKIDTRLQGSIDNLSFHPLDMFSYGRKLQREAKWIAGASPYMSQEKLIENMTTLIDKGISFDIKQRAFLMTIQEKIANTFDAADGTLLRLIRIQQQDTTAGRLGMESALNSFLNTMYETSEYLTDVAQSVRGSLEEMQALMEGKDATELEYQVQKWMGSLYSVGMSQEAVQNIAQTFGQIASGDISGLTGNGTGNLLIMAANEAGMSIADILQDGLKADETNKLMQAMVNYLAEIAETSSDSKVVQQQLANVYGIRASDLRAATNLSDDLKRISKSDKSYFGMMMQLNTMMNTLGLRTSMGEGISNMWSNIEYTMATSMAANPISYLLPKLSKMLKDTTGGIDLPFVNVMGFGVDLNTSVADLMSVAAMASSVLGSLGPVLVGLTDLVNPLAGTSMLMRAGINPAEGALRIFTRGDASLLKNVSGASTSESGSIAGQADGQSIKDQTMQGAEDDKKKQMVEAKDEESSDDIVLKSQQAVIDIYNLLEEVAHGSQCLRVRVVNNNGGAAGGQTPTGETPDTNPTMNTDNGNWVLSF